MTTHATPFDSPFSSSTNPLESFERMEKILKNCEKRLDLKEAFVPQMSTKTRDSAAFAQFICGKNHETKSLSMAQQQEFLAPEEVLYNLNHELAKKSSLRHLCNVVRVDGDHLDIVSDEDAAQVGWVNETDAREETSLSGFKKMTIALHHMYAKPRISQQLLDDSRVDLEKWLLEKVAHHMARLENEAFLKGDGKSQPKGILTQTSSLQNICAESISADVLLDVLCSLDTRYLDNASWLISPQMLFQIRSLKDQSGHFIFQQSFGERTPSFLLGYPIYVLDNVPAPLNKQGLPCLLFGDFHEAYTILDRSSLHMLRDPFSAKPFVEFYVTKRVGGDLVNPNAIKALIVKE